MNANFFRELPDYGGGSGRKKGASRRDANTSSRSLASRARVSNGTCGFSRPESGRSWIKKSLIIVKCDENTFPPFNTAEGFRQRMKFWDGIRSDASSCSSNLSLFSRRKSGDFCVTVRASPKRSQDRVRKLSYLFIAISSVMINL